MSAHDEFGKIETYGIDIIPEEHRHGTAARALLALVLRQLDVHQHDRQAAY